MQVLKELLPVCLNVWGIRFGNETAIKMNVRKVDLNKTVLEQDPFISAVGQPKEQTGDAAPGTSSERRKLLVCPFCETSRTFPPALGDDDDNLAHLQLGKEDEQTDYSRAA